MDCLECLGAASQLQVLSERGHDWVERERESEIGYKHFRLAVTRLVANEM